MAWRYRKARNGNIALTAEIDITAGEDEFVIALGFDSDSSGGQPAAGNPTAADAPRIVHTVRVIDSLLRTDTPTGPVWHRYSQDGDGEHADGAPFDSSGTETTDTGLGLHFTDLPVRGLPPGTNIALHDQDDRLSGRLTGCQRQAVMAIRGHSVRSQGVPETSARIKV
jgi:hypothetical protein